MIINKDDAVCSGDCTNKYSSVLLRHGLRKGDLLYKNHYRIFLKVSLIRKENKYHSVLSSSNTHIDKYRNKIHLIHNKTSLASVQIERIRHVTGAMWLFEYNHCYSNVDYRKNNRTNEYNCSSNYLNQKNLTVEGHLTCWFVGLCYTSFSI